MATILLVEDAQDIGLLEARRLEQAGHQVIRCWGGPTPFAACPMIRSGSCPLPDVADLIVFSCGLYGPLRHRTYRGEHLLRAYREHPRYGSLPMLVVSFGEPREMPGSGALEHLDKFSDPDAVVRAVARMLERTRSAVPIRN